MVASEFACVTFWAATAVWVCFHHWTYAMSTSTDEFLNETCDLLRVMGAILVVNDLLSIA